MTKASITLAIAVSLIAITAPFASAQEDGAETDRARFEDKLVLLADTLGKTHSIQVLCNGRADQFWRDQMSDLLKLEAPKDGPLRRKLIESFNSAYSAQDAEFSQCDANARKAFNQLAQDGRSLSESVNTMISNRE